VRLLELILPTFALRHNFSLNFLQEMNYITSKWDGGSRPAVGDCPSRFFYFLGNTTNPSGQTFDPMISHARLCCSGRVNFDFNGIDAADCDVSAMGGVHGRT
jgi:hypothetical protein